MSYKLFCRMTCNILACKKLLILGSADRFYRTVIHLASEKPSGAALYANDEFFTSKENLLKASLLIFIAGKSKVNPLKHKIFNTYFL